MIFISDKVQLSDNEVEISAIRSSGPGGQHTNKVSTAIQLKFDINNSSLAQKVKERLLEKNDRRISLEGVITIKSQKHRSQLKNKEDAILRLINIIQSANQIKKKRKRTKPSKASIHKRLESKKSKSKLKETRKRIKL